MKKDRNRRYETANGLAMDVQRYLADEPVKACPPSPGYRLRKFARRNRVGLAAAAGIAAAVLAGLRVSTFFKSDHCSFLYAESNLGGIRLARNST